MFYHNYLLLRRVWTHCMTYAFQFQYIFKIRIFTIDIASYTSFRLHKGFFRFSSPPVSKHFDANLTVTSPFQFINCSIFIFFSCCLPFNLLTTLRSFYFTVSVNIGNTNFSSMTILDYVAHFFKFSLFYISSWYFVSKIWSNDFNPSLNGWGFSAFFAASFQNISKKILLLRLFSFVIYSNIFIFFLLSAFLPINYITFVLFHGFREHCKHKLFSHDDSRCCLVIYIFAILCFPVDILSQEFDSMIYKSFSGVENFIPYPVHIDVAVGCPLLRLTYSKITI